MSKLLAELDIPVIVAPMAGGPSSPELVGAAAEVGGLGFLAAGYLAAGALSAQMGQTASKGNYGVNLFAPAQGKIDAPERGALEAYARELTPDYDRYQIPVPQADPDPSDGWEEKLAVIEAAAQSGGGPAVVSVTFGPPTRDLAAMLHRHNIELWVTVTNEDDASTAVELGADALVVQGPDAGGHRGTWCAGDEPDQRSLLELLRAIHRTVTSVPLVAAGGIATPEAVEEALRCPGVMAASCGTAFLLADEAGTSPAYRRGLTELSGRGTVTTRAFSGRIARGIRNQFIVDHDVTAPAIYPQVNALTSPIRRAAGEAEDVERLSLWAGTGVPQIRRENARGILRHLWPH